MRIMVLSHGHPELGVGGAEQAAYALFQKLRSDRAVEKAVFVARAEDTAIGHSAFFGSFRGRHDEILAALPPVDGFTFQSCNYDLLKQLVDELIKVFRPSVVHVHHFLHWGLEIFELFKAAGVRVVLTLHEYAAICANYGQMIKTDGRLCYAESAAECSICFSSVSAGKFFVRKALVRYFLDHVDAFIAPSQFLKNRYVDWGLPGDQIAVVENVLNKEMLDQAAAIAHQGCPPSLQMEAQRQKRLVFGFFGQITPFKGVDLLLEACSMLDAETRGRIDVRIHGENTWYTEHEFWKKVERLTARTGDVVRMMGAYQNREVIALMRACDWIIVPSIWWENSPIVMREARLASRPIICSNIGGMVEKVDPRVDLVFSAKSPGALADILAALAASEIRSDVGSLASLGSASLAEDSDNYAHHRRIYRNLIMIEEGSAKIVQAS